MNFPVDDDAPPAEISTVAPDPQDCSHPHPQASVDFLWTTASITTMRRLYPTPGDVDDLPGYLAGLARPRPAERPWVELCMVASIDGATAVGGRSGGLSHPSDVALLSALRACADVIIVGSTTAHAEQYGPPRRAGQRVGVVTSSGAVDRSLPLFRSGAGFLITTTRAPHTDLDCVRAGDERVDLRAALALLDADVVHAEGGPTLNAALLDAELVDEVNLTVSPALVGGGAPRLITGTSEHLHRMRLSHVLENEHFLFVRYERSDQDGSRTR